MYKHNLDDLFIKINIALKYLNRFLYSKQKVIGIFFFYTQLFFNCRSIIVLKKKIIINNYNIPLVQNGFLF